MPLLNPGTGAGDNNWVITTESEEMQVAGLVVVVQSRGHLETGYAGEWK
jgi:hypothetical protein